MQFGIIEIPDILVYLAVGGGVFWYVALRKPKSIKKLRREDKRLDLELSITEKRKRLRKIREEHEKEKGKFGW